MSISFNKETNLFNLETPNTSYIMGLLKGKHLVHIYWGRKTQLGDLPENILPLRYRGFAAVDDENFRDISTAVMPMEFPVFGSPDLRNPALHMSYNEGGITKLSYVGYKIIKGKPPLHGLPATYTEADNECGTLEIELKDELTKLHVFLSYSVFTQTDVITRSVRVENKGDKHIDISQIMSASVDFSENDFELIVLSGSWARERHIKRTPLHSGTQFIDSRRGASSHQQNPFMALVRETTTEEHGDAYGFSLVYSGSFYAGVEVDQFNISRAQIGINPFNFKWQLNCGESFTSPEAVLVYSANGLGGMSRIYHKLYQKRLCRGKFRDALRPVLINNWEATYFGFTEEKVVDIAKKAKEIGVELMVLDDGWFGERSCDTKSLGDWYPYAEKLPNGIAGLANRINDLGMEFGLWFEPEMISPDSDLFRAHPDWCIHAEGRQPVTSRHQLTLDYSRPEVCDYIIESVGKILTEANISYVKWDMNRSMADVAFPDLPHKYMLGLYRVLETLTQSHPDILFESCSGGGGRFDPGILYYMPQTWTSDDSDAVERLFIQYGTSMVYPAITMGAHVSAVPNHQTGRCTPIKTRCDVALMGQFGFELDLSTLNDDELLQAKNAIEQYKELQSVIHFGDMYRLKSPFCGNSAIWEFISEDKGTVVLCYYSILSVPSPPFEIVRLTELDETALYEDIETKKRYTGTHLMNMGLFKQQNSDFASQITVFKKVK